MVPATETKHGDPLTFTYLPITSTSGKLKEILWTSFYCIIPL